MGCNISRSAPAWSSSASRAPKVRQALEAKGVEVHTYEGSRRQPEGRRRPDVPDCAAAARLRLP